jgi:hypothetical protein
MKDEHEPYMGVIYQFSKGLFPVIRRDYFQLCLRFPNQQRLPGNAKFLFETGTDDTDGFELELLHV